MLVQTIKAPKQSMAEIALPDLEMLIICVIGFIMRRSVPTDEIIGDGPARILAPHKLIEYYKGSKEKELRHITYIIKCQASLIINFHITSPLHTYPRETQHVCH